MRLVIRVTGAAGLGMNSTADIIADVFAELGYFVNTDIEYQSIIKGGLNYFDIFVSSESKYISKFVDIVIALDSANLENALPFLKQWGIIISNKKHIQKLENAGKNVSGFEILPLEIEDKYDNTYLISVLVKLFSLPKEIIEKKIEKIFAKKGEIVVQANKKIFHHIYDTYEISWKNPFAALSQIGQARPTSYGNKMIALGATASNLEFFSGYPMTPASSVLTEVIKTGKVTYLQTEDEIAAAMSALGASFAGKRSMTATSGGGFALMVESISFGQQAEIPLVINLVQRAGPSTGTPTFHEQGDLNIALHPSFGDFEHIVLAPSTLENGYYFAGLALNLAQKYQTLVLFLTDKQFADGKATIDGALTPAPVQRGKLIEKPASDFARYAFTEDGISPYTVPWTPDGDFIATSYEHDEFWATTEDPAMKVKMTEKRWKKLENFYEKEGIKGYEVFYWETGLSGERSQAKVLPKKMLITTSYTSYTAKEFVKHNPEFGLIIIHFLKPLDARLLEELKNMEEVIFVESNYSGQLENYIVKEFGLKYIPGLKISHLRKYDLYPFYYEDFETLL